MNGNAASPTKTGQKPDTPKTQCKPVVYGIPPGTIIGLTGPMAAGKNCAANILERKGCAVIDADKTAHLALETAKNRVLEKFSDLSKTRGIELLLPDGAINRRNLGKLVFSSPQLLKELENITYPEVTRLISRFIEDNAGRPVVINAIALYKTELIRRCAFFIYVDSCPFIRFFRVLKRDRMPPVQIFKRFYAQKKLYAQHLFNNVDIYRVDNNSTPDVLEKKLDALLQKMGF